MNLPHDLEDALAAATAHLPRHALQQAAAEISDRYRSAARDTIDRFMTTETHCLAYLAVRLPATYAVVSKVLQELKERAPQLAPKSMADVGAGPGTATWAAAPLFDTLLQATLLERDGHWIEIGRRLMRQADNPLLKEASWQQTDLKTAPDLPANDLVVLSYVIGELPLDDMEALIGRAWQAASQALVVIEPGTPHGFARIRQVRAQLVALGAHLVAPCPHAHACPMSAGDWCHFSRRLERDALHRQVKGVSMGYEDEKYSYVIAAKEGVPRPEARIVRHPHIHSGHVTLSLCTQEGLEQRTVSKRHGPLYKQARKCAWGDIWPPAAG